MEESGDVCDRWGNVDSGDSVHRDSGNNGQRVRAKTVGATKNTRQLFRKADCVQRTEAGCHV